MAFTFGMTIDLCMRHVFMLVSITLTLLQDHSGLAEDKNQLYIFSTIKQVIFVKLTTTAGSSRLFFYMTLTLKTLIW